MGEWETALRAPCSLHWWLPKTSRSFPPALSFCCTRAVCCPQMLHLREGYGPPGMLQLHRTHLPNENATGGQPPRWSGCKDLYGPRPNSKPARPHRHQGCHDCSSPAQAAEAGGLPVVLTMQPQELQHQETPSNRMTPTSVSQHEH